jgi:RNA polymerase sigma factor (TIGR02999 family)
MARTLAWATMLVALASPTVHMNAEPQITETLARGDPAAIDALIPKIYATLRQLARRQRAHEAAHTLETTALVHEAYLKLANQSDIRFADRAHLYAYISRVMRHILIDHARRKKAQKRQAPEMMVAEEGSDIIDVLAIDEALSRLAALDQRLAHVAELRLFADLSSPDIAEVLGVNPRTVERDWLKARTFLSACLMPDA